MLNGSFERENQCITNKAGFQETEFYTYPDRKKSNLTFTITYEGLVLDWFQSLKHVFINVSFHIYTWSKSNFDGPVFREQSHQS